MKVAILAGGRGTRMSPDTDVVPKPMITVGGVPLLSHILRHYCRHGHRDFVVALGFLGDAIREHYGPHAGGPAACDCPAATDPRTGAAAPPCRLELADTGTDAGTGARVRRLADRIGPGTFMLTYGDAVSDVDISALLDFHRSHGRPATLTAVRPPARFGHLKFDGDRVVHFEEKPQTAEGWINGGYFVLEREVIDLIADGEEESFERGALSRLAQRDGLMAYRHESFWQCMDSPRDRQFLEQLWNTGRAPWIPSPAQ